MGLAIFYITIALPFAPIISAALLIVGVFLIVRFAARLAEILPG